MEFVLRGAEILAGERRDLGCDGRVEALGRVEAGADGGAAEGELLEGLYGQQQHLAVALQARSPAGDLLREGDGRRVLQMGAAGLYHALVLRLQPAERRRQRVDGGDDLILDRTDGRDVHRGREGVVGRLGHVDVVVRVQELFACDLVAAVGNDLVAVHVGLRAGAGLPDDQREVVQQLAGDDLVGGLLDGGQLFRGHLFRAQSAVGPRRGLLQNAKCVDDLSRHRLNADADREVVVAALGLCAPVFVGRDPDLAHRVVLHAVFHKRVLLFIL